MCRLNIAIDQSVHTLKPVFDLVDATTFYIRAIRLVPVASSTNANVHLTLGGGSKDELDALLKHLRGLPAVQSMNHTLPAVWTG